MTSAVRIAATGGGVAGVSALRRPPGAREEDASLPGLTD